MAVVVDIGARRDLLSQWDDVRKQIVKGQVHGWVVRTTDETPLLGGDLRGHPAVALCATTLLALSLAEAAALGVDAPQLRAPRRL